MAIYDILNEITDRRNSETGIASFNGYLEDYLSLIEMNTEDNQIDEETRVMLQSLFEIDNNLKIIVDLGLKINKTAIANQIIRYKDAYKLPDYTISVPFIIYCDLENKQRAMILTVGNQEAYIIAKALYYVISEPENEYEGTRNEMIAIAYSLSRLNLIKKALDDFFYGDMKAGAVQRNLDTSYFVSYQDMYQMAYDMAESQKNLSDELLKDEKTTQDSIYACISKWFLLKKFGYVQYMMDKSTLSALHEGNIKKQRTRAKEIADTISFISFSELWKKAKAIQSNQNV